MISEMGNNPIIERRVIKNVECLNFDFSGNFKENDAKNAIDIWKNHLEKTTSTMIHVWNCKKMTGYEPMARSHWQRAIKELKGKINKIWLISDSAIIIAGAKLLSIFTTFDIKAVHSEEAIVW